MLRDNLVGLIEPMLSSAGAYTLALGTARKQSSDDRPPCLENPRPEGAESTLTENAASPFHAEPKHCKPTARLLWRKSFPHGPPGWRLRKSEADSEDGPGRHERPKVVVSPNGKGHAHF